MIDLIHWRCSPMEAPLHSQMGLADWSLPVWRKVTEDKTRDWEIWIISPQRCQHSNGSCIHPCFHGDPESACSKTWCHWECDSCQSFGASSQRLFIVTFFVWCTVHPNLVQRWAQQGGGWLATSPQCGLSCGFVFSLKKKISFWDRKHTWEVYPEHVSGRAMRAVTGNAICGWTHGCGLASYAVLFQADNVTPVALLWLIQPQHRDELPDGQRSYHRFCRRRLTLNILSSSTRSYHRGVGCWDHCLTLDKALRRVF